MGDNVIQIQHSGGCDRWLVIKKILDASNISLQTKSGAEVESTEIALAFPLKNHRKKDALQVSFMLLSLYDKGFILFNLTCFPNIIMPPFEEVGVYSFANFSRSVGRSVHQSVDKPCLINNYRTHRPRIL